MHIFPSKLKSYFCFHIIAKVVRALKVVFFGICAAFVYIIWLAGAPDNTRAALRCLFLLTINLSDQFALSLSHLFDALLVQRELLLFSFACAFCPVSSLSDASGFSGEHRWNQFRRRPYQRPCHWHQSFAHWSAFGPTHSYMLTACFGPVLVPNDAAAHSTAECCGRPGQERGSCPLACAKEVYMCGIVYHDNE